MRPAFSFVLQPHRLSRTGRGFLSLVLLFLAVGACVPSSLPIASPTPEPSATVTPLPSATLPPTLAAIPTQTATPTPAPCRETSGQVKREQILSPHLAKALDYRVYYPPCYDDSGETRYPVLYMLHGQTYSDDQWVRLGITTAADQLIDAGDARPFLIVMPYESDTFADPYADGYAAALVDTLLPWIDAFYPTCATRECRAVGGLSRGGAYAFLLALDHPDLFAQAGGHSLVPFGGMENRLNRELAAMPAGLLPRLWIDSGQNDFFLADLTEYEHLLTQLDVPHEYTLNPGNHEEAYWSAHVAEYLRWYAAGFPSP